MNAQSQITQLARNWIQTIQGEVATISFFELKVEEVMVQILLGTLSIE